MDEIKLHTGIKKGDYVEFYPGHFNNNHWNESSVFLQEEIFHLIEPVIEKHVPSLNRYGPNEIDKGTWLKIINSLESLDDNACILQKLIKPLSKWLQARLKEHESIWVLGV